ncbi:hypothetical protein TrCOL_g2372 [Triparma columacea]|uniref:Uncharacterized protein n=1 Tax=Triparma columacea TaxID=722753 RepID=A0A9W7LCG3_9STRA|nr:hypothetical protein TrCOL_g2372 [Triparma columacea]
MAKAQGVHHKNIGRLIQTNASVIINVLTQGFVCGALNMSNTTVEEAAERSPASLPGPDANPQLLKTTAHVPSLSSMDKVVHTHRSDMMDQHPLYFYPFLLLLCVSRHLAEAVNHLWQYGIAFSFPPSVYRFASAMNKNLGCSWPRRSFSRLSIFCLLKNQECSQAFLTYPTFLRGLRLRKDPRNNVFRTR